MRSLDIKIFVFIGLVVAAFGMFILLEDYTLDSVPDENVIYIDSSVGSIEDDDRVNAEDREPAPDCDTPNECDPEAEDNPP